MKLWKLTLSPESLCRGTGWRTGRLSTLVVGGLFLYVRLVLVSAAFGYCSDFPKGHSKGRKVWSGKKKHTQNRNKVRGRSSW